MEHDGTPMRIEPGLKPIHRARVYHGYRKGVPVVNDTDTEKLATGPGHSMRFHEFPWVTASSGVGIDVKELGWVNIDSPMEELKHLNHVPSASPIVERGKFERTQTFGVRHASETGNHTCRPALYPF